MPAVEFCLWDALDDATNFQRNFTTGQVEVEDEVIYHKTEYRERRDHFAYFACSQNHWPASTPSARPSWGLTAAGTAPLAVERGQCANSIAYGWAPVGVAPGEADPAAR